MKSIGTQIAIDMYNCSDLLLSDASGVQATIQSAAADFAMQPRETYINCEEGINEYSVFSHCKQGHVTLHLYPDLGFVTIDVFTCFKDADPDSVQGRTALCRRLLIFRILSSPYFPCT